MEIIGRKYKFCTSCMSNHKVDVVLIKETEIIDGEEVEFIAKYYYCENAKTLTEDESMIRGNRNVMRLMSEKKARKDKIKTSMAL